jgi:hypothetical protein
MASLGFRPDIGWLWIALCIEVVLRCGLFAARFLHGGWARAKV